jgi:hypothetical protein
MYHPNRKVFPLDFCSLSILPLNCLPNYSLVIHNTSYSYETCAAETDNPSKAIIDPTIGLNQLTNEVIGHVTGYW